MNIKVVEKMKYKFIIGIIFIITVPSCDSANDQHQKSSSDCLPTSSIYLYSSVNDNYRVLFEDWQEELSETDKAFSNEIKNVTDAIDNMSLTLIEQAGGIDPDKYELVYPCREGGSPISEVFSSASYKQLIDKINAIKTRFDESKHVQVIDFLEYSLDNYLTGENAILNSNRITTTPYSILATELLILELNLLLYTQKALN